MSYWTDGHEMTLGKIGEPEKVQYSECSHCHKSEREYWIFLHEASGCRLCQYCLSEYIAAGIEEEGKDEFGGHEFIGATDAWPLHYGLRFQADNYDGEPTLFGKTVADCVESVLIKLKLI